MNRQRKRKQKSLSQYLLFVWQYSVHTNLLILIRTHM